MGSVASTLSSRLRAACAPGYGGASVSGSERLRSRKTPTHASTGMRLRNRCCGKRSTPYATIAGMSATPANRNESAATPAQVMPSSCTADHGSSRSASRMTHQINAANGTSDSACVEKWTKFGCSPLIRPTAIAIGTDSRIAMPRAAATRKRRPRQIPTTGIAGACTPPSATTGARSSGSPGGRALGPVKRLSGVRMNPMSI